MSSRNHNLGQLVRVNPPVGSDWPPQLARLLEESTQLPDGSWSTPVWLLQSDHREVIQSSTALPTVSHLTHGLVGVTVQADTCHAYCRTLVGRVTHEEFDHASGRLRLWLVDTTGFGTTAWLDEVRWPVSGQLTVVSVLVRTFSLSTGQTLDPCVAYLGMVASGRNLHYCVHNYIRKQTVAYDPSKVGIHVLTSSEEHQDLLGMPVEFMGQMGVVQEISKYGPEVGVVIRLVTGKQTGVEPLYGMTCLAPRPSHQLF